MIFKVVLVDDEPEAMALMNLLLAEMPEVEVVGRAMNGREALSVIEQSQPDLVLLDIQMPGQNGLDVARSLAGTSTTEVIFVTAFSDFAADAFELEAVDYLVKPVKPDRLKETFRRARRRLQQRATLEEGARSRRKADSPFQDTIWVPSRDGGTRVMVPDIRRIEAAKDYALLYTRTRTHIIRATMGELERKLDPSELLRIHRSFFVRPDTVSRVEKSGRNIVRIETDDGAILEVGASYSRRVATALDPGGELTPRSRKTRPGLEVDPHADKGDGIGD